jgi:hypothetical protein
VAIVPRKMRSVAGATVVIDELPASIETITTFGIAKMPVAARSCPANVDAMRRRLFLVIVAIAFSSGCVRESASGEIVDFHYKWWGWLMPIALLVIAGHMAGRHPSTWVNGVWRRWWTFRGWNYLDMTKFIATVVLGIMAPQMLCDYLVVGPTSFRTANWLGLRADRSVSFSDLDRIEWRSESPAGGWTPDKQKQHERQPVMIAYRRDGSSEAFNGRLVTAARQAISQRAAAAGIPTSTSDKPGAIAPNAVRPPAFGPRDQRVPGKAG